jgi:hypothetical protein
VISAVNELTIFLKEIFNDMPDNKKIINGKEYIKMLEDVYKTYDSVYERDFSENVKFIFILKIIF